MKYDPSDYPSMGGTSAKSSSAQAAAKWGPPPPPTAKSAKVSLKPTEDVSYDKFPGSWVTIGGSRGTGAAAEQNKTQARAVISDDDFPTLGGTGGKKSQKKQTVKPDRKKGM
ncbi:unnamed protein product [Symbiodinium microadriaticum]|nr:unnamed protein product [Symbiodinium microadriaticum]